MRKTLDVLSEILRKWEERIVRCEIGLGPLNRRGRKKLAASDQHLLQEDPGDSPLKLSLNRMSSNLILLAFLFLLLWVLPLSFHLWSVSLSGRSRENPIYLKDPSIRGRHARIIHDRGTYLLEGLEGDVLLRWRPLKGKNQLKPGDDLILGNSWFTFRQDKRGAWLRLKGFCFPRQGLPSYIDMGSSYRREGENGGRRNQVVLEDSSVYLAHARVRRRGSRFYLSNKQVGQDRVTHLEVNGSPLPAGPSLEEREIRDGDRIRLGRIFFTLEVSEEFLRLSLDDPANAPFWRLSPDRENVIAGLEEIPRNVPDFLEGTEFSYQVKRALERELIHLEEKKGKRWVKVKGFVLGTLSPGRDDPQIRRGKETPEGGHYALFDPEEYRKLSPEEEKILQEIFEYHKSKGSPLSWQIQFNRRPEHRSRKRFYSNELENFEILSSAPSSPPRLVGLDRFTGRFANPFLAAEEAVIERGLIRDRHGRTLAGNDREKDARPRRVYPLGGDLAHLIGYDLPQNGLQGGLESAFDLRLRGADRQPEGLLEKIYRGAKRTGKGDDLTLTLDADLQRICAKALRTRLEQLRKRRMAFSGAAVLLNREGEILAAVSQPPPYDPHDARSIRQALEPKGDWEDPLINRALHKTYPPGSTFKIVLAAAALEDEREFLRQARGGGHWIVSGPARNYVSRGSLAEFQGTQLDPVENFRRQSLDREVTLEESFALSINEVFAFLALRMEEGRIASWGRRFGFNQPIDLLPPTVKGYRDLGVRRAKRDPLRVAASPLPRLSPQKLSRRTYRSRLARMGIGQWEVRATPLQMALVALTVAREGTRPQPRLVKALRSGKSGLQREVDDSAPRETRVISDRVARELAGMMQGVVLRGTASEAFRDSPVRELVAGKTGTAEIGGGESKETIAWFISFAHAPRQGSAPAYALAVLLERGKGLYSSEAAAVAREIWEGVAKREGWSAE